MTDLDRLDVIRHHTLGSPSQVRTWRKLTKDALEAYRLARAAAFSVDRSRNSLGLLNVVAHALYEEAWEAREEWHGCRGKLALCLAHVEHYDTYRGWWSVPRGDKRGA